MISLHPPTVHEPDFTTRFKILFTTNRSNGSFGDDSPFSDYPYEGPMAGSLPLDGAFSLKSPESNIPVKNKMSEFIEAWRCVISCSTTHRFELDQKVDSNRAKM